jgi:hypothetical protein
MPGSPLALTLTSWPETPEQRDYLYLSQLPPLLFGQEAWPTASQRLGGASDAKQRLQSAIGQIAPVRNEIAHVREVEQDRLMRATVACGDVLAMIGRR